MYHWVRRLTRGGVRAGKVKSIAFVGGDESIVSGLPVQSPMYTSCLSARRGHVSFLLGWSEGTAFRRTRGHGRRYCLFSEQGQRVFQGMDLGRWVFCWRRRILVSSPVLLYDYRH